MKDKPSSEKEVRISKTNRDFIVNLENPFSMMFIIPFIIIAFVYGFIYNIMRNSRNR